MKSALDSLIEELERVVWQAPVPPVSPQVVSQPAFLSAGGNAWPPESLAAERRFGQPHARLFPFLGRKIRTPAGPGTLLQVFADRVTVLLDSELSRSSFFRPADVEPASWELP